MNNFNYEEAKERVKAFLILYIASLVLMGIINNVVVWVIYFAIIITATISIIVSKVKKFRNRF